MLGKRNLKMGIMNVVPGILDPIPGGKQIVNMLDYVTKLGKSKFFMAFNIRNKLLCH
jgi:hypothetical protein